jgi:hypothetical protein
MASGTKLNLFAVNGAFKNIGHSYLDSKSGNNKFQAITRFTFNAAMDMPAYLTTVRGRGGLGSANQKLMDVFWQMTTSASSSTAM